MRLSDLQTKSIVCVNDGKNIGNIIDANVTSDGTIESLVIEAVPQSLGNIQPESNGFTGSKYR